MKHFPFKTVIAIAAVLLFFSSKEAYADKNVNSMKPDDSGFFYASLVANNNAGNSQSVFTKEEIEYIENNKNKIFTGVTLCDVSPICSFDGKGVSGIIPDIMKEISEVSGIRIEIIPTSSKEEYYSLLNDRKIDLRLDATYDENIATSFNYLNTDIYLDIPVSKLYFKNSNNEAKEGDCGCVSAPNAYLIEGNNIECKGFIRYYDDVASLFSALNHYEISYAYLPSYIAEKLVHEDMTNHLTASIVPDCSYELTVAVIDKNNKILASIITKSINEIKRGTIESIIEKNTQYTPKGFSIIGFIYEYPLVFLIAVCVVIFGIAFITIVAVQASSARKQSAQLSEYLDFIRASFATYDFISEINIDEGKKEYTNYSFEKDTKGEGNKLIKRKSERFDSDDYLRTIHSQDKATFEKHFSIENLNRIVEEDSNDYLEVRVFSKKNSKYVYYSFVLQAMAPSKLHKKSILVLSKNIDETRIKEEEKYKTLLVALDTSRQFYEAKNDFMAKMSHDLRTPLNAIVGMSQNASNCVENPARVASYIDNISDSAEKLLSTINNILDMTNIESGQFSFKWEIVDICDSLERVCRKLNLKYKNKNIRYTLNTDTVEHCRIYSDEERMTQLFENIIDNAFKYSKDNGSVHITLGESAASLSNRHFYNLTVQDNGIGMDDDILSKIYTPFERSENVKNVEGTGLGLSIAKSILDAIGGIIKIESKLNVGTSVYISCCLSDENAEIGLFNAESLKGKKTIVISKDSILNNQLIKILSDYELSSISFADADDAKEYIEKEMLTERIGLIFINLCSNLEEDIKTAHMFRDIVGNKVPIIDVCAKDISTFLDDENCPIDNSIITPVYPNKVARIISEALKAKEGVLKGKITRSCEGKNALLAEDVEINRIFETTILEMKGFNVSSVENGKEAIDKLESSPENYYSLVLMDIQMPIMDGYKATKKIRNSEREDLRNIPIIAMSANCAPEDIEDSIESGMNDHLSKPIDINQLNEIIDAYVK